MSVFYVMDVSDCLVVCLSSKLLMLIFVANFGSQHLKTALVCSSFCCFSLCLSELHLNGDFEEKLAYKQGGKCAAKILKFNLQAFECGQSHPLQVTKSCSQLLLIVLVPACCCCCSLCSSLLVGASCLLLLLATFHYFSFWEQVSGIEVSNMMLYECYSITLKSLLNYTC